MVGMKPPGTYLCLAEYMTFLRFCSALYMFCGAVIAEEVFCVILVHLSFSFFDVDIVSSTFQILFCGC